MRFVNRSEATQVRIEVNGEFQWILLRNGEEIDIPEQQGINYGFDRALEAVKGKIGDSVVETKQIDIDKIFLKELIDIKGIGDRTAGDIMSVFPTREILRKAVESGKELPFNSNIDKLLEEKYGKRT